MKAAFLEDRFLSSPIKDFIYIQTAAQRQIKKQMSEILTFSLL